MTHGLKAAQQAARRDPARCPRVFIPDKRDGGHNYRGTCLCGERRDHKPPHRCPDCGGEWGESLSGT